MAIRNLRATVNRYTSGAVSPNFLGTWLVSTGYADVGDAQITGSIDGTLLTVTAVASGALAVGSLLSDKTEALLPATTITGLGNGAGGLGTYVVSPSQIVASEAMAATGAGLRAPAYQTLPGISFQVQALSAEDLQHIDGVNQQQTMRAIYLNGSAQGVQRPAAKGGDIFQIPTGLTPAAFDTWLVVQVLESWEADNWCKMAAVLQMPGQSQ